MVKVTFLSHVCNGHKMPAWTLDMLVPPRQGELVCLGLPMEEYTLQVTAVLWDLSGGCDKALISLEEVRS